MTEKVKIDYVFSGTGMLKLIPPKRHCSAKYRAMRLSTIKEGVTLINKNLNERLTVMDVGMSILFNAYTESRWGNFYRTSDKISFDKLYADSGGLQVVTRGKQLTDLMKDEIYKAQDEGDVAFCFDEIPLEKMCEHTDLAGSNRAVISSKIFNTKRFDECARKTAENVKYQLSQLSRARISYIIQGNTYEDMIRWFDIAYEVLGDDIEKLHGIALADTCMGNGELETCDMLYAGAHIFKTYTNLPKNLHLLGVGSGRRMLPAIILCRNGFMGDVILSSDSSTQSMHYMMGKSISFDKKLTDYESFKMFVDEMEPIYSKLIDNYDADELVRFILANNRQSAAVEEVCYNPEHRFHTIGFSICPLYGIWTSNKLFLDIERMLGETSYITLLNQVTKLEDYVDWRNKNYSNLQSKRIKRKRVTILDLMG